MEFWRYYRVLRQRRWLVVGTMLTAIVLAFAVNRPAAGDFAATANLSIPSTQQFALVSGLSASEQLPGGADRTLLAMDLIRSRDVAERTVQQFNLAISPEDLQRRLTVDKDPVTNLVQVTVAGKTPQDAVTLTNDVAQTAAAYDREVQRRSATLAREFIEKQAEGVQANLRGAEDALVAFQQQNAFALAAPRNSQVAGLQNAAQQVDLSLQETEARLAADRAQLTGQAATRSDPQLEENPIAQQLRGQLVQLEVALTSDEAIHTGKYPSVIALKAKIEAVKARLKSEVGKIVSSETVRHNPIYDAIVQDRVNLETERAALLARREAVRQALANVAGTLPGLAVIQIEQQRLARSVDILGRQFAGLQGQLGDARLREQEAQVLGSLSVVDLARGAFPSPFRGLQFKLTLAAVLGLLGGLSLVFFLEYADNSLKTPENAERLLGLPTLVAVPRHNPPFAEAFRRLRVNLTALEAPDDTPVLTVTGSRPGGGTSTVVANLARAFAQAGRRTIVVDTDFRRPTQHVHFGVRNDTGLLQVLAGDASIEQTIVKTDLRNLSILPAGVIRAETDDLVCSKRMCTVLSDLKQRWDVILLDTPPAGAFPDVLAIAPLTSGVVLVLDAGRAPRSIEPQVKSQLTRLGARILGTVLTKVRPDVVDAYVYHTRYYKTRAPLAKSPAVAATVGVVVVFVAAGMLTGSLLAGRALAQTGAGSDFIAPLSPVIQQVEQTVARWAHLLAAFEGRLSGDALTSSLKAMRLADP